MNFNDAVSNWNALSSTGIIGEFFGLMKDLAKLAENTHKLLNLL